jgi:hypothetical protein
MLEFPFKSKAKRQSTKIPVSDSHYKRKDLSKPNFSFTHGCWEIDLVFGLLSGNDEETPFNRDIHLFCINVNTRYLVVFPIPDKTKESILRCLTMLMDTYEVSHLKGDGERGFAMLQKFFNVSIDSSPYTYHNKTIDRVIRTIRDAIGYRRITEDQLQQIIRYYNNTYHRSIDCSPQQMQNDPDIEDQYIQWCIEKLNEKQKKLHELGLYSYKAGNILLLHLDESKTPERFKKIRNYWNKLGRFISYVSQSKVLVRLLSRNTKNVILPLYSTKLLTENADQLTRYDLDKYSLLLS